MSDIGGGISKETFGNVNLDIINNSKVIDYVEQDKESNGQIFLLLKNSDFKYAAITVVVVLLITFIFLYFTLFGHYRKIRRLADYRPHRTNPNNYAEPYVQKCMIIINARFKEDLKIEDITSILHISPGHLQQILRDNTGRTFIEHLNYVRMKCARKMLMDTNKKIGQIASAVGYENKNYFVRIFKNEFGMSPEKFKATVIG